MPILGGLEHAFPGNFEKFVIKSGGKNVNILMHCLTFKNVLNLLQHFADLLDQHTYFTTLVYCTIQNFGGKNFW